MDESGFLNFLALGSSKDVKSLDAEEEHPSVEVKELGRSKWSEIIDEDDTDKTEEVKGNALSGLIQAYHKEAKSVCWSDQVCLITSMVI